MAFSKFFKNFILFEDNYFIFPIKYIFQVFIPNNILKKLYHIFNNFLTKVIIIVIDFIEINEVSM